jgi:thioredoxin-like negative regulator of GroEL
VKETLRLMQAGQWRAALARIDAALAQSPDKPQWLMHRAQCLLALGRRTEAFADAVRAESLAPRDPAILDAAATVYSYGKDQQRALAAYDAAVALAPRNAQFLYNRASVRRFLGDLAGAESDYDQVIALRPTDYEAYKNRADLRTQTSARNHIAELQALAAGGFDDWRGEVQIRYALAKEYEDLGQYAASFQELASGAALRRRHLKYDVAADVATVQWIIDAFPADDTNDADVGDAPDASDNHPDSDSAGARGNASAEAPIFIVGLPRSGTTLVERILGSHSSLVAAGELNCFAHALTAAVRRTAGGTHVSRQELVARSAHVDFAALGQDYLSCARASGIGGGRFIDKMPLNYLYCGLIRRALPNAKLVHLTRHPLAVCYAMYKTLFADGYPFSYDLSELGQYYVGYRRLMTHWHDTMPGFIHDVSYEALVADQEVETRKLLAFCGLDWEPGCAEFHDNPAPSTTASAHQVRRPVYASSVDQWRHYSTELAPLRRLLAAAGISA